MSSASNGYQLNSDISDLIEEIIEKFDRPPTYNSIFNKSGEYKTTTSAISGTILSYAQSIPILNKLFPITNEKQQLTNSLLEQQKLATTYSKWYDVSLQLDELMGNNAWKSNPESPYYDFELIHHNINEMRTARLNRDYKLLLYLIRTKWVRNFGNIGDVSLYKSSFVGTKKLIEDYITECKLSLDYLVNGSDVDLDDRYLLGMLIQTRKNIGRTALVLSGGSTFGMFHIGVLVSLLEVNLLPRIISGSSAGSIIASILCCHSYEENKIIIQSLSEREFEIFNSGLDEEGILHEKKNQFRTLLKSVGHFLKYGTVFEMGSLKKTIIGFVGDLTFREAYNRTGKILNITVSPASLHEQTRLLNYLTAPNCLIWSAVCASCSLPGFFPSTSIYEKNPRTNKIQKWNGDSSIKFVDGSVDNDLPIMKLSEMFNVDHIIAVQVNAHVVPFLKISVSNPGGYLEDDLTTKFKGILNNAYDFFTCELIHYFQIFNEMDIYKNLSTKLISLLSQSYSGDITILPNYKLSDFTKVFSNPTPQFIADFIIRGARSTWPKITLINNHCGVEFELDRAITLLRGRTISSNSNSTFGNSLIVNPINLVQCNNSPTTEEWNQLTTTKSLGSSSARWDPVTPDRKRVSSLMKS
ncbi:patatin-domain-containing protein, partial [Yamadazyma tenuis ATCC 10573]